MIFVQRTGVPKSLQKNKKKWDAALELARASGSLVKVRKAESKYANADVRNALELMFNKKCAYCESEITAISFSHIEHFRPKSKYYKLCFRWTNLLLACSRCNSKGYKGVNFPLRVDGGPIINPAVDDPARHFYFVYDPKSKLALIQPRNTRAKTTERILGLNTRKALVQRRSAHVRRMILIKSYETSDVEAAQLVKEAKLAASEYSAWMNSLL